MATPKKNLDAGHIVDVPRIDPAKLYTRAEAGRLLGCNHSSVREYGKVGLLSEIRHGRAFCIIGTELRELAKQINKAGGFKAWARQRRVASYRNTMAGNEPEDEYDGATCCRCGIRLVYDPCEHDPLRCGECFEVLAKRVPVAVTS